MCRYVRYLPQPIHTFVFNSCTHLWMSRNLRSGLIWKRGLSCSAPQVILSSGMTAIDCPSKNLGTAHCSMFHSGPGDTCESSHCLNGRTLQSQLTGLPAKRHNQILALMSQIYKINWECWRTGSRGKYLDLRWSYRMLQKTEWWGTS